MKDYVSLHNHTTWSMMHSLIKPMHLFHRAKELGQSAVAVTDSGTMAAAWDCLKASKKTGVKLIMGCEFFFVEDLEDKDSYITHINLFAKNDIGYRNLLLLSKLGNDNSIITFGNVTPRIDWGLLEAHSTGTFCTTSCGNGIISHLINTRQSDKAFERAKRLKSIFGDDLAFEVQPHAMVRNASQYNDYEDQTLVNRKLIKFGDELGVKIIAATNAHYLYKHQWRAHDTILSIGSGVPVRAQSRLKYNVPEFYVKSREEVESFFKRHYGDRAAEFCDNTLYFANKCEDPEWIDPKWSNPSGKELPQFPVKDQKDYSEFKQWLSTKSIEFQSLAEDVTYLRYLCSMNAKRLIPKGKEQQYKDRIIKELDVIESLGFSSYMLIVADIIDFCKRNNYPHGIGRGCLTGDAIVYTTLGPKQLSEIKKGDYVYTHTGSIKRVEETFEYDVDEKLINIKSEFSFKTITMTPDHKVFGVKRTETDLYKNSKNKKHVKHWNSVENKPQWYPVSEMKEGDCLFTPFPQRIINNDYKDIDLAGYLNGVDAEIKNKHIILYKPKKNDLTIRNISRSTGVDRGFISRVKNGKFKTHDKIGRKNTRGIKSYEKIAQFLKNKGIEIKDWVKLKNKHSIKIKRFIKFDKNFLYLLGRFVGDGWICKPKAPHFQYNFGLAFNSSNSNGIDKTVSYLKRLGFSPREMKHNQKDLVQVVVYGKLLFNLFSSIFRDYKYEASTKHLPTFFRNLPDDLLEALLIGCVDSDGHISSARTGVDTTSKRLVLELKEAFLYLKKISYISIREPFYRGPYLCKTSYKIRFSHNHNDRVFNNGYYSIIKKLRHVYANKVYDIKVQDDHSYLTTNYVVHNSVGGCMVAYLLGIHQADPIKYDLIFERFLNKEKKSYPDIDSDFASYVKKLVQEYIINKYGEDYVAHVSNLNTITPKVYARDIARAYEFGGTRKDAVEIGTNIADSIPDGIRSVTSALENAPLFAEFAERYTELKEFAKDVGGIPRARATHAGGLIIGKRPLHEIIPLRRDKDSNVAIEYEKDRAEENGLVKMDILGLSTLDVINNTLRIIKSVGKDAPRGHWDFDSNDEKTYDLISRGDTLCVFQLGKSAGTIDLCRQVQPKCIEDIAIINSLARPSARDIRKDFIETKHGKIPVEIMHPSLQRAFGDTYGFGLYEECLMYLAQDVAGWDLNKADRLRKLTKEKGKNPKKTKQWRKEFINDSMLNGIEESVATNIWDKVIQNFSGYGFNKSHAIFYSMLGYQTAYLKAHYPVEFLTANLILEDDSNAKISEKNISRIKREMRKSGINILPPHINKSDKAYKILNDHTLLTGFRSIKYMGKDAIPDILEKRPFKSFEDFMLRIDGRKTRITAIQALIASGCFDCFGMSRKQMFLYAKDYRDKLKAFKKRNPDKEFNYPWPEDIGEWTLPEKYAMEVKYMGEAFCCGIKDAYRGFFDNWALDLSTLPEIYPDPGTKESVMLTKNDGVVEGVITDYFEFKVKNEKSKIFGEIMAKADIEDIWGNIASMTIFPGGLEHFRKRLRLLTNGKAKLEPGIGVHCSVELNWYEGNVSMIFKDLSNAMPLPPFPKEMKHKKVSMKASAKKPKKTDRLNPDQFLDLIEDELIMAGHTSSEDSI